MYFLWLISMGYALPVVGDAQVVIGEKGFDFTTNYLEQVPLVFEKEIIESEYECWDRVGIIDFNIETKVKEAIFSTEMDALVLQLWFDPISGTDMEVFAEDSDIFDFCPSYSSTLNYLTIENMYVEMALYPYINEEGTLSLEVLEKPLVEGDLDMDVSWFPDNIVLYFFEDQIFDTISVQMEEKLPLIVAEYSDLLSYQIPLDPINIDIALSDTKVLPSGLQMAATTEVHFTEDAYCTNPVYSASGRSPELEFSFINDAAIGFGLTEKALNQGASTLWSEGYFCFSPDDFDFLLEEFSDFFDASQADLKGTATLDVPPEIRIGQDGLFINVYGGKINIKALSTETNFVDLELNLNAKIDFLLDRDSASFGLTLHDLELDFITLDIEGLISEDPYAEQNIRRFIEVWLVSEVEERIQNIPLFASLFQVFDLYLFVDKLHYVEGGFEVYVNLFQEGDPEIDDIAPDTSISVQNITETDVEIAWEATDDREGVLLYSFRFDDESWSSWSEEKSVLRSDLIPGNHIIHVKSRDQWWNEDQTPALESFFLSVPEPEEDTKEPATSCGGCASVSGQRPSRFMLLLGMMLMGWGYTRRVE
jgi:hypothetical protein